MKPISPSILKTWIFLAQSSDAHLAQAKFLARQKIKRHFGSIELAQCHLEQLEGTDVEIVII